MNILITGASKGIGKELTSLFFSEEGNNIIAIGRSRDLIDGLAAHYKDEGRGSRFIPLVADITTEEGLGRIEETLQQVASLDVLVNNAGFLVSKSIQDVSYGEMQAMFQVNVFAAVRMVQVCLPYLRQGKSPQVINIGSMGGVPNTAKFPGLSVYSASKAAVANLTECMAGELASDGIRANCLALGAAQTEMLTQAFPLYKAPFSAREMAGFIKQFIEIDVPVMNGQTINVAINNPT